MKTAQSACAGATKIPFEFAKTVRGVGNSANAAVSAARLGISSGLLSWVGDDANGQGCIEALKENSVDTSYIHPDPKSESNQHYVLWYQEERTILVKQNSFPYAIPEGLVAPRYLYLSSLGESAEFHNQLTDWLEANPETKLVLQPGTFQMKMGVEALKRLYARTELIVINKEEAGRILQTPDEQDIKVLLQKIHELGPKMVAITDDVRGAYAFDGEQMVMVPMYPDQKPPYERTGAGDAFASSITIALALGKPFEEALLWGPINSMSVVQKVGAQEGLLMREDLEKFLADAPPEYKKITRL